MCYQRNCKNAANINPLYSVDLKPGDYTDETKIQQIYA